MKWPVARPDVAAQGEGECDDMKWDFFGWQQVNDLMEQAERIQRNVLEVTAANHYLATSDRAGAWAPSVNVIETDEFWWVISALPGVEANQVSIWFEGNDLIIAGTRPLPTCCSEGELKIWEIPLGRFERRLRLAPGVKFTIGETRIADGLLIAQLKKSL
jgi:HSP20 family molecular chaperone IbpA